MANFQNQQLTNAGWDALSEALAGRRLKFVRMAVGDGDLAAGAPIEEQTDLVHHVMDATITDYRAAGQGKMFITGIVRSAEVAAGFFLREIGLFATIEDGPELLYSLSNAEEEPDYIPSKGEATVVIQAIEVQVLISKAEHVEVEVVIGEVGLDGENVGGGAGWFIDRVANRIRFKTLVAEPGILPIEISQTATTIGLAVGAGANGGGLPDEGDDGTGDAPLNAVGSGAGIIQVGTLLPFAGARAPRGYLIANGREVRRAGYPALFAVIGTSFGAGNGTTTFNLPDTRSRALVGTGPLDIQPGHNFSLGLKYGAPQVTLTVAQLAPHGHDYIDINHTHDAIATGGHNHGDPGHAHYAGGGWHDHGPHSHTIDLFNAYQAHWVGTGYAPQFGGSRGTSAAYAGANYGANVNTYGAGCGLHNAGNLGGYTGWCSPGHNIKWINSAGSGHAHENCGPRLGINYIIKV